MQSKGMAKQSFTTPRKDLLSLKSIDFKDKRKFQKLLLKELFSFSMPFGQRLLVRPLPTNYGKDLFSFVKTSGSKSEFYSFRVKTFSLQVEDL